MARARLKSQTEPVVFQRNASQMNVMEPPYPKPERRWILVLSCFGPIEETMKEGRIVLVENVYNFERTKLREGR